ncbi:glycosyltransferase involved in cell wall biosynthesis [Azospirillum baldaniorum]|uniref:glycosyltransferase family 2 protein n=1 Tax=Azospirillum baldaniorum TaxID=1064539 RepID=UPI0011A467A7|nr:glycosyltransferase family 2 protein [Azospirillum baldaniorum]TWA53593.1 glycosyltransferase involved in cell wall biosynthesis [Azospirillum baldaniorum]
MSTYSLVIPCYNEARNLPLLLARAGEAFTRPDIELVLVDNGSTDDSSAVLRELLPRYPFARSVRVEVNQGYGFGILSGLRAARGRVLGWTHADMQTDPADALTGFALFDAARDPDRLFVKGRRQHRPLGDAVFTAGMGLFETALLRQPLWDINAQPTLFGRGFFETWANPPHDFSLDLYAFYMARAAGLEVKRFPVLFGKRAHGTSHWNINWRAKVKFIRRTLDYSLRLRATLSESRSKPESTS